QPAAHPPRPELSDARAGETYPAGAPAPEEGGDPEVAREQIERTRARMSETIDEIEDVLVRKKEQIQERLDFLAPVRERPLASLGVVLGAGLVLGLLTGGGDDEDRSYTHRRTLDELQDRAESWERRARRLMRVAREQEEELAALTTGRAVPRVPYWSEERDDDEVASGPSAF